MAETKAANLSTQTFRFSYGRLFVLGKQGRNYDKTGPRANSRGDGQKGSIQGQHGHLGM